MTEGTVLIGSEDDHVYALDAGDGAEQWRYDTGGRANGSPTVAGGTVFVGSDAGVVALETGFATETPGADETDTPAETESPATPTAADATPTDSGFQETATPDDGDPTPTETDTEAATDADGPGFGVAATIAGLGGAGYLLGRHPDDER